MGESDASQTQPLPEDRPSCPNLDADRRLQTRAIRRSQKQAQALMEQHRVQVSVHRKKYLALE